MLAIPMSSNAIETDFTLLHSLLKPCLPLRLVVLVPFVLYASTVILVLVARSTIGSGGDACITVWFNVPDIVGEQWCGRQELEEEK